MTAEQIALFINYGVLGVFTVLWLTDRIQTKGRTDRAESAADKAMSQVTLLSDAINKLTSAIEQWRAVERREGPR
jgi:hypothetical protein